MNRKDMINAIMDAAIAASGVTTMDPVYLAARRELEANTDDELRLLARGVETGAIFEAARRVAGMGI